MNGFFIEYYPLQERDRLTPIMEIWAMGDLLLPKYVKDNLENMMLQEGLKCMEGLYTEP